MLEAFSITDIGRKRQLNEDSVIAIQEAVGSFSNLFIVADGMGGHKAGDYASRETVDIIKDSVSQSTLQDPKAIFKEAVDAANHQVFLDARSSLDLEGMGTTVVACTIAGNKMYVMNVGDSRLYRIGEAGIAQITEDHSLVEEMVKEGIITRERARNHPKKNIITRAVGVMAFVEPDFFEVELMPGDRVLLCSDGLCNMLEDEEIQMIVGSVGSLEEKAKMLVDAANGNGGKDNISVILIEPFAGVPVLD